MMHGTGPDFGQLRISEQFRQVPRGINYDELSLCAPFVSMGFCRLGDQCASAHSLAELDNWKKQFKSKLSQLNNQSLAQKLQARLSDDKSKLCLSDHLPGVTVTCDRSLVIAVETKPCHQSWIFVLETDKKLKSVFLLRETHLENFWISSVESIYGRHTTKCTEWQEQNREEKEAGIVDYVVSIQFESSAFGTFRKDLIFDFGMDLYISKSLCIDVLPGVAVTELERVEKTIWSESTRWDSSSAELIPFDDKERLSSQEEFLLKTYPAPNPANFKPTQALHDQKFTEENYRERMKNLITLEELEQSNLVSNFNICTMLELCSSYMLTPGVDCITKYSLKGELFAIMHLTGDLSEDTAAGRLILTSSNEVLLKIVGDKIPETKYPKVYEAIIEDKLKQYVYLRLPKALVSDFNLKAEKPVTTEVQFQLNRLPFCERLFAVDRVNIGHVLPSIYCEIPVSVTNPKVQLNERQKEAVDAVAAPLSDKIPIVALVGPFGTGKTYTFAEALKALAETPGNRALVCTYSNSAADLYVKDHLHPAVVAGNANARPLRIFYHKRWLNSVHPDVLEYALYDRENRMFRYPTMQELEDSKIVIITLSLSRKLLDMGLPRGFFTHILIDEAAQCLECDAIIPLSLATEKTRIALAGDYMQLSPVVYSSLAREKGFHISLLERLYDYYPDGFPCRILLVENYRSHSSIVKFTSDLFYEGRLRSSGNPPGHSMIHPLAFYAALGEDIQDSNSTAYYNLAEVYEVVERVIELKKTWPASWGEFNQSSIGVVAPYVDQVVRIRSELRRRKLHGVSVERILNVQGKEFRVIIMSTVRTRLTTRMPRTDRKANMVVLPEQDYGLLSDERLVNAALTRAQSLVIAVGDPIALCAIGKCRKLWEKYIDVCQRNGSFFGMQSQSLRFELDAVDLQILYGLNPLAPVFMPGTVWSPFVNRSYYDSQNVVQHLRPVYLIKPIYGPMQRALPVEGQPLIAAPPARYPRPQPYNGPMGHNYPATAHGSFPTGSYSPWNDHNLRPNPDTMYAEMLTKQAQYHMQQLAQLQMVQMQLQRGAPPQRPSFPSPLPMNDRCRSYPVLPPMSREENPHFGPVQPPRYIPHTLGRGLPPVIPGRPMTLEELEASLLGDLKTSKANHAPTFGPSQSTSAFGEGFTNEFGSGANWDGGKKSYFDDGGKKSYFDDGGKKSYFENGMFVSNGENSLDGSLGGSDAEEGDYE